MTSGLASHPCVARASAVVALLCVACDSAPSSVETAPFAPPPASATIEGVESPPSRSEGGRGGEIAAPTSPVDTEAAGAPGTACPKDMRLIAGNYCPLVSEQCLAWNEVNVAGKVERLQCKEYRNPTRCLSAARERKRFCMDAFEWPNQEGAIPRNLTSWQDAKDTCEGIGKRLCTEDEFNFACEGEAMRPHVTGFTRDPSKCSYDREYRQRTFNFLKHDACLAAPPCAAALAAIDQRLPAGSMRACVSDHGVYDLNGNVNEWVMLPGRGVSKRSGLKGGWWGPVRDRCRPVTTFHGESDFGYEVGFRCCKDAT